MLACFIILLTVYYNQAQMDFFIFFIRMAKSEAVSALYCIFIDLQVLKFTVAMDTQFLFGIWTQFHVIID